LSIDKQRLVSPKERIVLLKTNHNNEKQIDLFQFLVEGTSSVVGENFFSRFVENLANAFEADMAIVAKLQKDRKNAQTLAVWQNNKSIENFEYELKGTPCGNVYESGSCYYPNDIQQIFPDDKDLVMLDLSSYFGVSLRTANNEVIGHVCVLGKKPLAQSDHAEAFLRIFSARAGAELERLEMEQELIQHRDHLTCLVDEKTEELRHAKELAEAASRAKTYFLERMSHELKTPLNGILGMSELLQHFVVNSDRQQYDEYLLGLTKCGWHLNDLLNDLLDFATIDSAKPQDELEQVILIDLLKQSLNNLQHEIDKKSIMVELDRDLGLDVKICTDKTRLQKVISHLFSNAVKFNREHGKITISVECLADSITIFVTDTGKGLGKKEQQQIFNEFERLHAEVDGVGIGLALSKRLIEHMGGSIGVDSQLDKGSTFWIKLPLHSKS